MVRENASGGEFSGGKAKFEIVSACDICVGEKILTGEDERAALAACKAESRC
jgi:hypothetical protein